MIKEAKPKELTLQDIIEGDILKNVNKKIQELESRKSSLESEIDKKREELTRMVQNIDKEIDQKIQKVGAEAQEHITRANKLLKEAETKLKTAEQRERDSAVIEGQMKRLDEKNKASAEAQKSADNALALALEKERKANLLIEQYTKRLDELGEKKEGKKEEKKR